MSWFKLTDEERREWRAHPSTLAYFESIREQISDVKDELVSTLLDEAETAINHARRMAGRVDGFETAIKLMERDP